MAGLKNWAALALLGAASLAHADTTLLNVSYDVTRELYKDIDAGFVSAYKQKSGETVSVLIPAYNEEKVIALTVERKSASPAPTESVTPSTALIAP